MEYDPRRQFGYPVLRANPDVGPSLYDYVNRDFDFAWGASRKGPEYLSYQLGCQQPELRKAIEDGSAGYFLSVRCTRTLFHEVVEIFDDTDEDEPTYRIPFDHLKGRFRIQLFILGKKASEIKSQEINDFFGKKQFQFKQGQILAFSPEYELDTKLEETVAPLQIFKIEPSDDIEDGIFKLVLKDAKVSIQVSKAQRTKIRALENQGEAGLPILRASIQVPVLQHLIHLLLERQADDQLWVDYLQDEINKLDPALLDEPPYLEAAQLIAEKPMASITRILGD